MSNLRESVPASARKSRATRFLPALLAMSAALAPTVPAQAAVPGSDAEKLVRLDIMLMVTGLRCRKTSDDFWSDYGRFTTKHMSTLNGANREMRALLARRMSDAAAKKQLDRMSVTMANQYGQGHPWLKCDQLKMVASNLSRVEGRATLVEAAEQLLSSRPVDHLALAEH